MSLPEKDRWPGAKGRECGEHRPLGIGYSYCYECSERCSQSAPCARCELPELRATVERVEALLATHPSAVWVSELRAALGDPR